MLWCEVGRRRPATRMPGLRPPGPPMGPAAQLPQPAGGGGDRNGNQQQPHGRRRTVLKIHPGCADPAQHGGMIVRPRRLTPRGTTPSRWNMVTNARCGHPGSQWRQSGNDRQRRSMPADVGGGDRSAGLRVPACSSCASRPAPVRRQWCASGPSTGRPQHHGTRAAPLSADSARGWPSASPGCTGIPQERSSNSGSAHSRLGRDREASSRSSKPRSVSMSAYVSRPRIKKVPDRRSCRT